MLKTEQLDHNISPEGPSVRSDSPPALPKASRGLRRWLGWLLMFSLGVLLVGLAAVRWWVWPELQRWQPQVEAHLSQVLGTKVTVGGLEPGFNGFYPSIVATDLVGDGGALSIGRVDMEFSPRALLARQVSY
jgi:uncharacterized protein YhdP